MAPTPPAEADPKTSARKIGQVDQSFYLIGVGASAGGLDAIKQIIGQVPQDFAHSLVIVQHISPDYKSLMSEILGRETSLPVREVTDNMAVEARHIYLIPPRSNIVIQGTKGDSAAETPQGKGDTYTGLRFSLVEQTPRPGLNLPIDVFFHSLAEAVEDRAIAVILSGSGSDGSRGLRAIKDREGFVLVQDPDIAAFDGMPRSAIATGIVDMVVSPDQIVGEISRFVEMRAKGIDSVDRIFHSSGDAYRDLLSLVSEQAELDFRFYKEPTLKRRIARRMALRGDTTLEQYLAHLRTDTTELNVLCREFLVGVTNFFRDLPVWRNLQETIVPGLFAHGDPNVPVRIWSVGCSTGEEAYTIAMLIEDYRTTHDIKRDFRIYATDVNESAISAAKQGIYPDSVREEIPDYYLNRGYLSLQSGTFTVAPHIRNKVVFSVHNVIEDAPFTRTDMIVCRNLLIYLSPDIQAKIMTHFSFSLRQDGILQLGAAETPGQHGAMFQAMVHKMRVYRNTRRIESTARRSGLSLEFAEAKFLPRTRRMDARTHQPGDDVRVLLGFALEDANACVCIADETGKIIRTFGDHSRLLHIPSAGFSANLLELVDDRLRSSVALVLRRAETEGLAEKTGVRLVGEDSSEMIDITCRKLPWEAQALAYAVTFRSRPAPVGEGAADPANTEDAPNLPIQSYVEELENEVQSLQDMLSATAEDLGASNEELQTTNEELIASNEELQANNEETQSINEELYTLNAENSEKIAELEAVTGDVNNLLATADLAVLVLDDHLRIRQFSAGLQQYVQLEASDVGRPLENFALQLEAESLARLMDDIRISRDNGEESSRNLRGKEGGYAFSRVRPYRNIHGARNGVVVTLEDVTDLRLLEIEVREQRDRLASLLEGETAGYSDTNLITGEVFYSPRMCAMLGYGDTLETPAEALIHPDDRPPAGHDNSVPETNERRWLCKDGTYIWILSRSRITDHDAQNTPIRMMAVHMDVTLQKERELAVQRRAEELRRFSFVAAHDLIQPMNTIDNCINLLTEEVPTEVVDTQREVFGFLAASVIRMKERINGILDFSSLQDETFEFVPVDLAVVVKDCFEDLSTQIAEAEAKVDVAELPHALGSARLVLRVIQNLLSNALKYRHPDRPCQIQISETPAPEGMVAITIADNGIGIPKEHRVKVFELFARLHTEQDYPGSGLGLAMSQRIVEKLEGDIAIFDGLSGGTAVTVTLKRA